MSIQESNKGLSPLHVTMSCGPLTPTIPRCSSYNPLSHTSPGQRRCPLTPTQSVPLASAEQRVRPTDSSGHLIRAKKILSLKLSTKLPLSSVLLWRQLMGKCPSLCTVNKFIHYSYSEANTALTLPFSLSLSYQPSLGNIPLDPWQLH